MAKFLKYVHLAVTLCGVAHVPDLFQAWLSLPHHEGILTGLVCFSILLHAALPSIFGGPSDAAAKQAGFNSGSGIFLFCLLLGGAVMAHAQNGTQTLTLASASPIQNFYAAGGSYSVNASPSIAGTGFYAHLVANSGTYAFTAVDALPATKKPFTVTSNIGVGIAQKLGCLGKVCAYMPTSAGVSWSGSNTGWQWNGGALVTIPLKNNCYLAPTVRVLKSSVSGGTGYQPIVGLLFGWGK